MNLIPLTIKKKTGHTFIMANSAETVNAVLLSLVQLSRALSAICLCSSKPDETHINMGFTVFSTFLSAIEVTLDTVVTVFLMGWVLSTTSMHDDFSIKPIKRKKTP